MAIGRVRGYNVIVGLLQGSLSIYYEEESFAFYTNLGSFPTEMSLIFERSECVS